MKSKKKTIFITLAIVIFCLGLGIFLYFYFTNPNRLNTKEKRFIAESSNVVQNVSIVNNVSLFGTNGSGIFYDFLNDVSKEYDLKMNPVTFNLGENKTGVSFTVGNTLSDNEFVFFKGHYVLLSKSVEYIGNTSRLANKRVGILSENVSYVKDYLTTEEFSIVPYSTREELLNAFDNQTEIDYIFVPIYLYLDTILSKDYYVAMHFSDIPYYYKINTGDNSVLGNILEKYFNTWKEDNFDTYYKEKLFNLFVSSLNISLTDVDAMRAISYDYSFVNNSPYEILTGGNYGGILAQYLKEFSEFSDIELKFTKYKTSSKLHTAIKNGKVNFYFGYYVSDTNYNNIHSGIGLNYSVVANKKNSIVVQSLKSLNGKEVYVEKDTVLYDYLKSNLNATIKTYETEKELEKIVKKGEIVLIDSYVYSAHQNDIFNDYSVRFSEVVDMDYYFKLSTNETFSKLFSKFVNIKDPMQTIYKGIYNYDLTFKTGTITGAIAKYFMYILVLFILIFMYIYHWMKKRKVSKKLKREDKLKYIDQLTSLKNRNYLTENLSLWSQNKIYPQAVVVIDLNNLQYINDTMGYEHGDEQIKAAANILVKTQLDNSDIVRTDGNEFVIYLIGYQAKQITSYIHKLNKEFKRLPYEQGAAVGYSMIEDDIKTVEDAINEAVEEVKKQKENKKEEK